MKKLITLVLALTLVLTACQSAGKTGETKDEQSGKKVVTASTSFIDDMVNILAGDKVERKLIIPHGEDPHTYIASPNDLSKVTETDLVLYHGLHFEGKIADILEEHGVSISKNFDPNKIGIFEEDGVKAQDPHFWFDLDLYKDGLKVVKEELIKLLPSEEESISKNYDEYVNKLDELDKYIVKRLEEIPANSRYLVTPHDAFNYFSNRYGIEVMAPQGISTDSEVANAEIEKTANFIVEHKIKSIFAESTTNPQRMEKLKEVVKSKGFDVNVIEGEDKELFSDSLAPQGSKGDTFIDMYKHNVDLIVDNLK